MCQNTHEFLYLVKLYHIWTVIPTFPIDFEHHMKLRSMTNKLEKCNDSLKLVQFNQILFNSELFLRTNKLFYGFWELENYVSKKLLILVQNPLQNI